MIYLTVKTRQKYLKELGFYKGKVDGKNGPLTKAAIFALQKKYFVRDKDKDGIYGTNTEILLVNVYRVHLHTNNFDLVTDSMMKCQCGGKYCTGYPAKFNAQLLKNLQGIRDEYGPLTVTSGLRCQNYNNSIPGSIKNSKHISGKAIDFFVSKCSTEKGRKEVMEFARKQPGFSYTYCSLGGSYPNMGNSIHIDVK